VEVPVTRFVVFLIVAAIVAYPVFRRAREFAETSLRARVRVAVRGVIGTLAGLVLAVWLPQRVPETPGSPATIVALLTLWIVGGSLTLLSLVSLLGAAVARPDRSGA
jgi:hypothetical protein